MVATLIEGQEPISCGPNAVERPITQADAKVMLARATTSADRKRALAAAMDAGMPLYEIEEYSDWADAVREHCHGEDLFDPGQVDCSVARSNVATATEFAFVLPNDQAQITPVVEFLAAEAIRVAVSDSMEQMRISLALEEALVNALYHGNLEIDSDAEETEQVLRHELAQRRNSHLPFCDRRIRVFATIAPSAAVFVVRDEGRGFDPSLLRDPTDEANLGRCCGRGVYLMRNLMDEVTFNEIGNEVTMVRRWVA